MNLSYTKRGRFHLPPHVSYQVSPHMVEIGGLGMGCPKALGGIIAHWQGKAAFIMGVRAGDARGTEPFVAQGFQILHTGPGQHGPYPVTLLARALETSVAEPIELPPPDGTWVGANTCCGWRHLWGPFAAPHPVKALDQYYTSFNPRYSTAVAQGTRPDTPGWQQVLKSGDYTLLLRIEQSTRDYPIH